MTRKLLLSVVVLLVAAAPARAQSLRSLLEDLFTFGTCGQPLCLDLPPGNTHGSHFIEAFEESNRSVVGFITEAVAKTASNLPISSSNSGVSYSIVNGLPVRTTTSAGPVFAERSRTLGRGRFFLGSNFSAIRYTTLNGVPLDELGFNFGHQDTPPAPDTLGNPEFENDIIRMNMGLEVDQVVASIFATWGITDFIDLGVAVPFIRVQINGTSVAQIDPFGPVTPHRFGGTDADPVLRASSSVDGSAAGIGDVVGRLKVNLGQSTRMGAALLGEVRLPTGDEENLLGSGSTSVRAMAVFSMLFGGMEARFNGGYVMRTGELQNDAIAASLGFDNLLAPWMTLAFDIRGDWQVGDAKISLPPPVQLNTPFVRTFQATNIPERDENRLDASMGLKFNVRGGTVLVMNGIVPIRKVSLQPDFVWTMGLEFNF